MQKIVLAIGGSSGAVYAQRLIQKLSVKAIELDIILSNNAKINWELEIGPFDDKLIKGKVYDNKDFFAPFASGSAKYDTMIICPSSMGLLGRISNGISNDLITRAADVFLKERRRLIVVPREMPYNLIHLRNMTSLTEAGAIICPATPSFYSKPNTVVEVIDTVVDRVIDLAKIDNDSYRWGV